MKTSFKSLIAVVAATAALVGCSKDAGIDSTPETKGFSINLVTDGQIAGGTRTEFDEAINNIKWSAGDAAKIYLKSISNESTAEITETGGGKNTATFKGTVGAALTAGTYKIQGFYPSSAFFAHQQNADKTNITSYALTLPSEQTASLASFDKNADILIAQDMDIEITESDIAAHSKTIENFRFGRAMAISKYTFALDAAQTQLSKDEIVEYVTLTVESSKTVNLTGRFRFAPATGQFVEDLDAAKPIEDMNNVFYSLGSPSVTVKFSENVTLGNLVMWAVTAPVKLVSGDVLKFTIKTDKNTIVRTSTLTKEFNYLNNQLNTATVNLSTENIEITPKPAGETATLTAEEIGMMTGETAYGSTKTVSNDYGDWVTNGFKANKTDQYIQLKKDDDSGNYFIQLPSVSGNIEAIELNVTNASGGNNSSTLYFREAIGSANIAEGSGGKNVTLKIPGTTPISSGYIQSSGAVRISGITITYTPSTDPYIKADNIKDLSAAAGDFDATYEVKNSTSDVTEEPVTDGIVVETAIAGNGTVAYSVTPNYGTETREGWIELALADNAAVKKRITVTQSGSTFKVSKKAVDIPNDATETTFTVLSKEFDWTITAPAGITVTPSSGSAGNTEIPVTVSSTTENTGTTPLPLGTLSILLTGDEPANALSIEVNKLAAGASEAQYIKVTSELADWSGEYLIVYEDKNTAYTFNGGLPNLDIARNFTTFTITSNSIASNTDTDACKFTIEAMSGGYSIKSASGSYISRTTNSNGMDSSKITAKANVISYSSGKITIKGGPSGASLQYFASSGSERFRYYKSSQQAISLYKLSN